MKKIKSLLLAAVVIGVLLSQQSCIGSFQLTNNLYNWNKNQVSGKWGQELVFLAFVILPVYEVCLFADGIVLNAIEFWTGSNPLALAPGETETKIVQQGDDMYKLSAERNTIHVEKIAGSNAGETGQFIFDEQTRIWSFQNADGIIQLKQ